jgi:hypothetical protein
MLPIKEWPDEVVAAVTSIEVQEIGGDNPVIVVKKIKFRDKGAALDKLFKNCGIHAKVNEQKATSVEKCWKRLPIGRRDILTNKRNPGTIDAN